MRILVVDDQKTLGMALSKTLVKLGHEPHFVNAAAAAWEMIDRQGWRLIITDWIMPDVDGLELCRRIRSRRDAAYRYVIMLSSRGDRADRLEGLQAGADDFMTKPVDEDELKVRLAIARRILDMQADLKDKNALLESMASTVPLTGVGNRRRLGEAMQVAVSQATRGIPSSVVALDIDHFKAYNDAFGHPSGDEVLRIVANLLRRGTRPCDLVARTGGEEFLVVLPGTGRDEAVATAERLRMAIAGHHWSVRPVTASFGVATVPSPPETSCLEDVLESADQALYRSKRSGRNRVSSSHRPVMATAN